MKIKIILIDRAGGTSTEVEVDQEKIVHASMIVYRERYYAYAGSTYPGHAPGRFNAVRFVEANPPVVIE